MRYMFNYCFDLQNISLNNFNTANVIFMRGMFYGCYNLQSLDVSSFETNKTTDMASMFSSCSKLPILDIRNFNVANVLETNGMFSSLGSMANSKPISVKVTKATYDILSTKSTGINEDYAKYVIE